jgi:hypothetical protein
MVNNKTTTSSKKAAKVSTKNMNKETLLALRRLATALKELDDAGKNEVTEENIGIAMSHWRDLPPEVDHAYKMMSDGAELIKATSTKYTLIGKIDVDDGSKFCNELRQGCELISTSAFLIHQPSMGCARSTRHFAKQNARAVVATVLALIESFESLRAINGNTGAQLTGAVWSACDKIIEKNPKGNRTCIRRELFTWVAECNETMQEFQDLLDSTAEGQEDNTKAWDKFCSNPGTGENYTSLENPIVMACIAIVKCSRGILGLAIKSLECAGDEVGMLPEDADPSVDKEKTRRRAILQWMSNLHECSRNIGEGATDLGYLLYPPLDLCLEGDEMLPSATKLGQQILQQKQLLLTAAHTINDAFPAKEGQEEMNMSEEVKEMSSKLLSAITIRSADAEQSIASALQKNRNL